VNLEDVARLVREGRDVRVVDARSGEDVTRLVLAQIILEEARAEGGETGVPLDFLREIIRASDRATRDVLQWSLALALEQSKKLGTLAFWPWNVAAGEAGAPDAQPGAKTGGSALAPGPVAPPAETRDATGASSADAPAPPDAPERPVEDEMIELKRRLALLESRVARERRRRRKREQ
jgi:polyhydroxyalkanoate synthesis repressor PhaR